MSTAKEYVAQFCKEAKVTVLKEKIGQRRI